MAKKFWLVLLPVLLFLLFWWYFSSTQGFINSYNASIQDFESWDFSNALDWFDELKDGCKGWQCQKIDFALGHVYFWSWASAFGSSIWFFDRLYAFTGDLHHIWELKDIDNQIPIIQSSWQKSVWYFESSKTQHGKHNADTIRKMLWDSEKKDNETERQWDDETEWLNPKQQQQLNDYSEKLKQAQKQDQKYYNKKQPSSLDPTNPLRIISELLGGDKELPDTGKNEIDR